MMNFEVNLDSIRKENVIVHILSHYLVKIDAKNG